MEGARKSVYKDEAKQIRSIREIGNVGTIRFEIKHFNILFVRYQKFDKF